MFGNITSLESLVLQAESRILSNYDPGRHRIDDFDRLQNVLPTIKAIISTVRDFNVEHAEKAQYLAQSYQLIFQQHLAVNRSDVKNLLSSVLANLQEIQRIPILSTSITPAWSKSQDSMGILSNTVTLLQKEMCKGESQTRPMSQFNNVGFHAAKGLSDSILSVITGNKSEAHNAYLKVQNYPKGDNLDNDS